MQFFLRVLLPTIRTGWILLSEGNSMIQVMLQRLIAWHRRQIATDPAYPTILAVLFAAILRLTVRNRTHAAILASLIARGLGLNLPDARDDGWHSPDDYV